MAVSIAPAVVPAKAGRDVAPFFHRHCERSEAIQSGGEGEAGLLRRCAPRNDDGESLLPGLARSPPPSRLRWSALSPLAIACSTQWATWSFRTSSSTRQRGTHGRDLRHDVDAIAVLLDHLRGREPDPRSGQDVFRRMLDVLAHALYTPRAARPSMRNERRQYGHHHTSETPGWPSSAAPEAAPKAALPADKPGVLLLRRARRSSAWPRSRRDKVLDPVCGMTVDPATSASPHTSRQDFPFLLGRLPHQIRRRSRKVSRQREGARTGDAPRARSTPLSFFFLNIK